MLHHVLIAPTAISPQYILYYHSASLDFHTVKTISEQRDLSNQRIRVPRENDFKLRITDFCMYWHNHCVLYNVFLRYYPEDER